MKIQSFLSVVVPIYEVDENKLHLLHTEIESNFFDFEIILVSDTCTSRVADLSSYLESFSCIRHIHLSGNIDIDVKFAAGCENSVGDFVVLYSLDSDPVSVIVPLFEACRGGADVVIGCSDNRSGLTYSMLRRGFGFVLSAVDYDIPEKSTDLRCLSRRAVNAITRVGRYHHRFYMRIQKSGYRFSIYRYKTNESSQHKDSISSIFSKFLKLLIFNSTKPLRWVSSMGCIGSFLAFIYASYSLLSHIFSGNVANGWTTTIFFMSSLFMIQFIILSFLVEYLARILDEEGGKDEYSVVYERNSIVMLNEDRVNVFHDAEYPITNEVQTGRNK